ncbi:MAG: VOC family protein [Brevundimonas sp.]|uniref:VOC family protein n=1 Tax=Brevundimonas sp. TaxID=1871086 RepID=UPI00120A370A|nr:VOC family protein [Brevundimonas sp.]RZJ18806.1 MAG: VOC family protein [Brevundimonas sp.]
MFTHVTVGSNDLEASTRFYNAVLGALGTASGMPDEAGGRVFYLSSRAMFGVTRPIDGQPACHANGGTIGFAASSTEAVDAFHKAGVENGGVSVESPPGVRNMKFGAMYLAYLRDPAGNKICAVHRMG